MSKEVKVINPDTHIYLYAKYHYKWGNEKESLNMAIIRKCLSYLRLTDIKYIPNLGTPDPKILTLSQHNN